MITTKRDKIIQMHDVYARKINFNITLVKKPETKFRRLD